MRLFAVPVAKISNYIETGFFFVVSRINSIEKIRNSAEPHKQSLPGLVCASRILLSDTALRCLNPNYALMKKCVGLVIVIAIVLSSCASSKPYYKTSEGKRKQKYYNDIQFGGRKARKGY
jgi:hypothetical protein